MLKTAWRIFFGLAIALPAWANPPSQVSTHEQALEKLIHDLKLPRYKGKKFVRTPKFAIFDNGYEDMESEKGKLLPADTEVRNEVRTVADQRPIDSLHGTAMARVAAQMIKAAKVQGDYKLVLFNTYGFSRLEKAVKSVIAEGFDVVLYSGTWEAGGNGDGTGEINDLVKEATDAGIIWINAAGDFGKSMRRAPVTNREWVQFKGSDGKLHDQAKVTCTPLFDVKPYYIKTCALRIHLAWTDRPVDAAPQAGETAQPKARDLDLFVYDSAGKLIAQKDQTGEREQVLQEDKNSLNSSVLLRELLEYKLSRGTYTIKIRNKSMNFDPTKDEYRLSVSGAGGEMEDPDLNESLLPPADNPGVIVIGASDSPESSRSKRLQIPRIWLPSILPFAESRLMSFSTSNAAAAAAALAVVEIGLGTERWRDTIERKLMAISQAPPKGVPFGKAKLPPEPATRAPAPAAPAPAAPALAGTPGTENSKEPVWVDPQDRTAAAQASAPASAPAVRAEPSPKLTPPTSHSATKPSVRLPSAPENLDEGVSRAPRSREPRLPLERQPEVRAPLERQPMVRAPLERRPAAPVEYAPRGRAPEPQDPRLHDPRSNLRLSDGPQMGPIEPPYARNPRSAPQPPPYDPEDTLVGEDMDGGPVLCSRIPRLPQMYAYVAGVLDHGGAIPVQYKGRPSLAVDFDFHAWVGLIPRPGVRVFLTPRGVATYNERQLRARAYRLPFNYYEVIPGPAAGCR